jgi:hypothetical protein
VRVGEPEVERDDRGLDEEAAGDERERGHDEAVVAAAERQPLADLREVERVGPAVEERDPRQDEERAERVRDGDVERALERALDVRDVARGFATRTRTFPYGPL